MRGNLAQKSAAASAPVRWGGRRRNCVGAGFSPPLQAALIIIVNLPGSISRGGAKFNVGPSKAMKSSSSSSSAEFIGCARISVRPLVAHLPSFIAPGIHSRSGNRRTDAVLEIEMDAKLSSRWRQRRPLWFFMHTKRCRRTRERRQRLTRVRERRLEDFDTDGRELRLKRKDLSDGEAVGWKKSSQEVLSCFIRFV